ncbi:hypothetical protein [Kineococcus terrestris]|uniref:hypothetical protein n=1 Tax=Kineococcus terrestris TaxID=2044856 RepID=UPI0034DB0913
MSPGWLRPAGDVALAVLAAAVSVGLGIERTDAWDPPTATVVLLVVLAAVLAVASTTWSAVAGVRSRRRGARREVLDRLLSGALWAVVDLTGRDARELATAAYRVRGDRLVRLHRVRARRRPGASGTAWAVGQGVLGRSVAEGRVVAVDLAATPQEGRGSLGDEAWGRLRGLHEVVVAVPVVDDAGESSRVVGCVVLDGPAGSLEQLTTPAVLGVLEAAGALLLEVDGRAAARSTSVSSHTIAQGENASGATALQRSLDRLDGTG